MTTTAPVSAASWRAAPKASLLKAELSTPLLLTPASTKAIISLALPRMMVGWQTRISSRHASVRALVAPAPTGSSTIGIPLRDAAAPAILIPSSQASSKVPIFSTRAPAMDVISSTSRGQCAMTGEAPMARSALAELFITT